MREKVGFIGLGIMGMGMARNLLRAGYPLMVWNRSRAKADALAGEGVRVAQSARGLAAECEVVLLCVSDTPDVEQVILGSDGVLQAARPGLLVVDLSTISPTATREIAAQLRARGAAFLDAPVSGGSEGAARGTLSIMVGGEEPDFARALPILQAIGKTITHVGGTGAGQMTKLMNQILVVGNALAISEALLFAQAGGLDLNKALAAVSGGAAGSWMLSNRAPQILARDWRPGFTIDLQQKDLRLVLAEADKLGIPTVLTGMIFQFYRTLQAEGLGSEGNHALVKALERLAKMEVRG